LMGAVLLATASFAQYHSDEKNSRTNDVVYNDSRYNDHNDRRNDRYGYGNRERDFQIARINREYDRRIESVKHKWMSRSKKEAIICSLEENRRHDIRRVYEKYRHHRFDDRNSGDRW
jgi:hypothetical protein